MADKLLVSVGHDGQDACSFFLDASDTVFEAKCEIQDALGIPQGKQVLFDCNGRQLFSECILQTLAQAGSISLQVIQRAEVVQMHVTIGLVEEDVCTFPMDFNATILDAKSRIRELREIDSAFHFIHLGERVPESDEVVGSLMTADVCVTLKLVRFAGVAERNRIPASSIDLGDHVQVAWFEVLPPAMAGHESVQRQCLLDGFKEAHSILEDKLGCEVVSGNPEDDDGFERMISKPPYHSSASANQGVKSRHVQEMLTLLYGGTEASIQGHLVWHCWQNGDVVDDRDRKSVV